MKLDQLPKILTPRKKRVGRGIGSGMGKTSGRGSKGLKARGKVAAGFIGGTLPLYKKLPFLRGHARTSGHGMTKRGKVIIKLDQLEKLFAKDEVVSRKSIVEKGLFSERQVQKSQIKIVGSLELTKPLTVELPATASATKMIEKAGGKVINA